MTTHDFLHRFKRLLDTLTSHPQVRVTHVWIGPPADDAALDRLAKAWGHLPESVNALYRQANGVQLRWVDRGDELYAPARDDVMQFEGPWAELYAVPGRHVGLIALPTADALAERDNIGEMLDAEVGDPLHAAVTFESFEESADAVVYFGNGTEDPWIGVASDHLADIGPPGVCTLSAYLDRVLSTWASVDHRGRPGDTTLEGLLRVRAPLNPARVIGQRVVYMEHRPDFVRMHGLVTSLVDVVGPAPGWDYAPTLAEVESDLGETVYVPLAALDPPDDADRYEELRADVGVLRRFLDGPMPPMLDALGLVTEMTHGGGTPDGPVIMNHAWAYAALTTVLAPEEAARRLLAAAQRVYEHPDLYAQRDAQWPVTRPKNRYRCKVGGSILATGLFEAAVIHIGRAGPPDLAAWLGGDATRALWSMLEGIRARDPQRGYDPLRDASKPAGWLAAALNGGPTAFSPSSRVSRRGGSLGLADLRVVSD